MLAAERSEVSEIILREEIADRPAEIPEESLAHLHAVDDSPSNDRHEWQQIVPAPLLELLAELGRPVLAADLVAVDEGVVERLSRQRTDILEHGRHHPGPVLVHR